MLGLKLWKVFEHSVSKELNHVNNLDVILCCTQSQIHKIHKNNVNWTSTIKAIRVEDMYHWDMIK